MFNIYNMFESHDDDEYDGQWSTTYWIVAAPQLVNGESEEGEKLKQSNAKNGQ